MSTEDLLAALVKQYEVKEKPKTVSVLLDERRAKLKEDIANGIVKEEEPK